MRNILLICMIVLSGTILAQERDTYQADSIYAKNNIKVRFQHRGDVSMGGTALLYDKQGRNIKYYFINSKDLSESTSHTTYLYDDQNRIIMEIDSNSNDVRTTVYEYEEDGSYISKNTWSSNPNHVFQVNVYDAATRTNTYSFINLEGDTLSQKTTVFDLHNNKIKYSGWNVKKKSNIISNIEWSTDSKGRSIEVWEYEFVNKYDDKGRLIRTERYVHDKLADTDIYTYDEKGLLIEKGGVFLYNGTEISSIGDVFEYDRYTE